MKKNMPLSFDQKQKITFNNIPIAILASIIQFLSPEEILKVIGVSKIFKEAYLHLMNPNTGKVLSPLVNNSQQRLENRNRVIDSKIENVPTIYDKAIKLMCCIITCVPYYQTNLSKRGVNVCRLVFSGICGLSSYAFYLELNKPDKDFITWATTMGIMGISGGTLLIDAGQSGYFYYKKRKIAEQKVRLSEISSLITTRSSPINQLISSDPVAQEQDDETSPYRPLNPGDS